MVERPLSMREVPGSTPGFSIVLFLFFFFLMTTIFAITEIVVFVFNLFVFTVLFSSEAYRRIQTYDYPVELA